MATGSNNIIPISGPRPGIAPTTSPTTIPVKVRVRIRGDKNTSSPTDKKSKIIELLPWNVDTPKTKWQYYI
jgi:hypothetical protein